MNWIWDAMKGRLARQSSQAIPTEYAIAQAAPNQAVEAYQLQLTGLLVQRLHRFCRTNGMQLVIVDLPHRDTPLVFHPSIVPALAPIMAENSERVLWSTNLFADYQNTASIAVLHGQWHLSEVGHAQVGIALAKEIIAHAAPAAAGVPARPAPPAPAASRLGPAIRRE